MRARCSRIIAGTSPPAAARCAVSGQKSIEVMTKIWSHLGRPFDDRREVRMVMGAQAARLAMADDLFEAVGQALVVVAAQAVEALRAAADDEMLRAEIRRGVARRA